MVRRLTAHWPVAIALAAVAGYATWLVVLWAYSHHFMDLKAGVFVCRANCESFLALSEHLLRTGSFADPFGPPFGTPDKPLKAAFSFYTGFVSALAALRLLFGDSWPLALVLFHGSLVVLNAGVCAALLAPQRRRILSFVLFVILSAASVRLAIYAKFVLTDFAFAQLALLAFLLLAAGVARSQWRLIAGAILVASLSATFKFHGLLVLALVSVSAGGFAAAGWLRRPGLALAAPAAAGAMGFAVAMVLSSVVVSQADRLDTWPPRAESFARILLEINFAGEDTVATSADPIGSALGAQIYVSPDGRTRQYRKVSGGVSGISRAAIARVPYVLEEMTFGFTRSCYPFREFCYAYRPAFQIVMFALTAVGLAVAMRSWRRVPGLAVLGSTLVGFLLLFVSVSLVMMRYLLAFEMLTIALSSLAVAHLACLRHTARGG